MILSHPLLDSYADSWFPLILPLLGFGCSWIYAFRHPKLEFAKWNTIHIVHHIGAMTLGLFSLFLETPERINILWSISYFLVDWFDSCVRFDLAYVAHHTCCLLLGLANYHFPVLHNNRMNSRASFCELSTPFLHEAQRTREPWRFVLFAVVFTLCRMVWIPILYRQLIRAGLAWNHPIQLVFGAFYLLNCFWYYKIVRILVTGGKKDQTKAQPTTSKKEE